MTHAPAPFIPFEDHKDLGPEAFPAFLRVADRIDAGATTVEAVDHLSRREKNHLARLLAGHGPLDPWLNANVRVAAQSIREACQ